MIFSVIRLFNRVALDFNDHFVRDRRDCQRSFGLLDIVVAFFEVRARCVADRVRNAADICNRSRRLDIRHFAFNKAAFNLHVGLRQRCAVVRLVSALARQRHRALGNIQRTKRRCDLVFAVNFFVHHEDERVLAIARILLTARHGARHFVFSNKANSRHRVVLQRGAVVDLLIRSRGQRHVLIIVESNLVISFGNCLFLTRNRRMIFNFLRPNH